MISGCQVRGLVSHRRMVFFLSLSFQGSPAVCYVSVSDAMVRHLKLKILSRDSGSQLLLLLVPYPQHVQVPYPADSIDVIPAFHAD